MRVRVRVAVRCFGGVTVGLGVLLRLWLGSGAFTSDIPEALPCDCTRVRVGVGGGLDDYKRPQMRRMGALAPGATHRVRFQAGSTDEAWPRPSKACMLVSFSNAYPHA